MGRPCTVARDWIQGAKHGRSYSRRREPTTKRVRRAITSRQSGYRPKAATRAKPGLRVGSLELPEEAADLMSLWQDTHNGNSRNAPLRSHGGLGASLQRRRACPRGSHRDWIRMELAS